MNNSAINFQNQFVPMRDGVHLAVSIWHLNGRTDIQESRPAVLIATRYWRALAFKNEDVALQPYYGLAANLLERGYRLVIADVRGTGASFGCRFAEVDKFEVEDIGELISWASAQLWCNGQVATFGVSYTAITALYSPVYATSELKVAICRAPDFDMYRHLFAPGGVVNRWFIEVWGDSTAAQDSNDAIRLYRNSEWQLPNDFASNVLGVKPVEPSHIAYKLGAQGKMKEGGKLLAAVEEHQKNFNIGAKAQSLTYIEDFLSDCNPPVYATEFKSRLENRSVPLVITCGWHDAGTQLGALALYCSFKGPIRIVLGPWNHDGSYDVDPFGQGDGTQAKATAIEQTRERNIALLDEFLNKKHTACQQAKRSIAYYTLGQNRWKSTVDWPLPNTTVTRLYFDKSNQLSERAPIDRSGSDTYRVDSTATTGTYNRWHAQSSNQPVHFADRREEDSKLLIYDSLALEQDTEITGHPLVSLYLCSTASDGHFFVYLESVDTDGRVCLLTEGQLRGIHRKVSKDLPPYAMFGPYHSLMKKDAEALVPGEIAEICFDLFPISVLLKKGQRIRVAIAGADKDTFAPISGAETPELEIYRNCQYASYIELPIVN